MNALPSLHTEMAVRGVMPEGCGKMVIICKDWHEIINAAMECFVSGARKVELEKVIIHHPPVTIPAKFVKHYATLRLNKKLYGKGKIPL